MKKHECRTCHSNVMVPMLPSDRKYNEYEHFLICIKCRKSHSDKLQIKKSLINKLQKDIELNQTKINKMIKENKYMYIVNKKDYRKYYWINDFNIKSDQDHEKERESKIKEAFYFSKLNFKRSSDVMSFIKFGEPSIDEIIKKTMEEEEEETKKIEFMLSHLDDLDIGYDSKLPTFVSYVKGRDRRSLEDVVNDIKDEYDLFDKTMIENK